MADFLNNVTDYGSMCYILILYSLLLSLMIQWLGQNWCLLPLRHAIKHCVIYVNQTNHKQRLKVRDRIKKIGKPPTQFTLSRHSSMTALLTL